MAETPHELCPWTPPTLCTVVPSLSLPIWDVGCREAAGHLKVSGAPGSGLRFSPRSLAPGTQVRLCGRTRWGRRWDSVGGVDSVWALGILPSWSMEEQQAEPFSSGSWCRALLGTLVAKQTREHPLKLQRLEPAGPELDPPHQCATSVRSEEAHV